MMELQIQSAQKKLNLQKEQKAPEDVEIGRMGTSSPKTEDILYLDIRSIETSSQTTEDVLCHDIRSMGTSSPKTEDCKKLIEKKAKIKNEVPARNSTRRLEKIGTNSSFVR